MINAIKNYLEEQCKTDAALAAKYNESKLDYCISYINSEARKLLKGSNGGIDDATVYQWARHFFMDGNTPIDTSNAKTITLGNHATTVEEALQAPHENPQPTAVDVEAIKKQAAAEAIEAYKAQEKQKAEEAAAKKAAEKAEKEAAKAAEIAKQQESTTLSLF